MKRLLMLAACLSFASCLSARTTVKRYYVLHAADRKPLADEPLIDGLVRVRNLDTDRVYEKFQIVVRRSPYELSYSGRNLWAVKPNEAISALLAQDLAAAQVFSGV